MSAWFGGPVAPQRNPPIRSTYYKPSRFVISDITLGESTTITTSTDHDYVVGQEIRVLVPLLFGCQQIDNKKGIVTSIPASNQVIVNINSVGFDSFDSSETNSDSDPQILAIGDYNSGQINASGRIANKTFIDGSFQNISPG